MGKIKDFDKINWKPFKKRFGNIEVKNFWMDNDGVPQPLQSHLTDTFNFFEVVRVYPNSYYGTESEYEFDETKNMYKGKYPNTYISPSCFKNPESNMMLASWVNINHDECTPDLQFVGKRPLELNNDELQAFWSCVKVGQEHIEEVLNNFDEDE